MAENEGRRSIRKSKPVESSVMVLDQNLVVEPQAYEKFVLQQREMEARKKITIPFMAKVREVCAHIDVFAAAHSIPVHVTCIIVSTGIIPICAISIVWDILAATLFQIPDLSTINTPGFVLFLNFIAIPLAMYGYMMEYLIHEQSRLALIAAIGVVVHPILFMIRAMIEYVFDGFRAEEKLYFEGFVSKGQEAKYPIGIVRYREGQPYSDSVDGKNIIKGIFERSEN